ncbi:unnamed protein product, partial [Nesidiocoris tenuis]
MRSGQYKIVYTYYAIPNSTIKICLRVYQQNDRTLFSIPPQPFDHNYWRHVTTR